jgi:hypothetical protein
MRDAIASLKPDLKQRLILAFGATAMVKPDLVWMIASPYLLRPSGSAGTEGHPADTADGVSAAGSLPARLSAESDRVLLVGTR